MSKHTPAPWTNLPRHECIPLCRMDDAGLSIGFVHSADPKRQAEGLANSYLVAAAPDLLDALEAMNTQLEADGYMGTTYGPLRIAAIAAIAKAKGESK